MKHRLIRFRRVAVSCIAGATALTGLSVLGLASAASAAGLATGSSIVAATPTPNINANGTNQPVANETITLAAGTTWATGNSITVNVTDSAAASTITWDHNPTLTVTTGSGDTALCAGGVSSGCTVTGADTGTTNGFTITIALTGTSQVTGSPSASTLVLSNIGYSTGSGNPTATAAAAGGAVIVTATAVGAPLSTGSTFTNSGAAGASNAVVRTTAISALFADNTPVIAPGSTGAAAGTWELTMNGAGNSWASGDKIYITIATDNGTNCETAGKPDTLGFAAVPPAPTVTEATNGATVAPTVTLSVAQAANSSCSTFSGVNNELVVTFTNSGSIENGFHNDAFGHSNAVEITISGVTLNASADIGTGAAGAYDDTTALGNIDVAQGYNAAPTFGNSGLTGAVVNDHLVGGSTAGSLNGPSNATIGTTAVTVTSNKPSTTLQYNITSTGSEVVNQAISPITIAEGAPGALGGGVAGWACLTVDLANGFQPEWNPNSTPSATASGGGMAVGTPQLLTPGGQTGPTQLVFQVTTPSSGSPGTITLSNLSINFPGFPNVQLLGYLYYGATSSANACNSTSGHAYPGPIPNNTHLDFTLADLGGHTFGQNADDTAAQEFGYKGVVNNACGNGHSALDTGSIPPTNAVLVTDTDPYDALGASYLAGFLGTGVLTSPTNGFGDGAPLNAIRLGGVTDVYVVGGPLVESQANVTQLQGTPSYNCDGSVHTTNSGATQDLVVHWIYGNNADATAADVGDFPGPANVGTTAFPAAYDGRYNDTTGSNGSGTSSAPDTASSTAIVATDTGFQDSASMSAMAYFGTGAASSDGGFKGFPLFLNGPAGTPGTCGLSQETASGLTNDAIRQVILAGGPLVNSDAVATCIEGLGISVDRVAGIDFTDTSVKTAQLELANHDPVSGLVSGLDWDPTYLMFARGDFYTDGITASGISGQLGNPYPILLTWDPNNTHNPSGTDYLGTFLGSVGKVPGYDPVDPLDGTVNNLWYVGGPLAITPGLAGTLATDLNG